MSKIKFGIASLQAAQENYNILLDKLIKGYQKIMKKDPEGLDLIKIKQEARQRADESAKVVDMQGRNLDPSKGIMGGTQDFGENIRETYDAAKGPGKGDEMVEALKSPGAIKSSEIIEAQLKETFPDIKLFGDETFEEILEIQKTGKHPRMKADGGRVNLQVGGLPLSEQGQRIYDSMTRAGFDEMAIARALDEQQAYPEATTLGLQPQTVVPPRVQPILPINQGDSDSGGNIINRDRGLMTADVVGTSLVGNMGLTEEEQEEVNQQKRKSGLMNLGKTLGFITNPLAFLAKKGYDMYQSNVQRGIDERIERMRLETIAAQEAEEREAATRALAAANQAAGTGGFQYGTQGGGGGAGSDFMSGSGTSADMGSFAKGGLATMFVRKR